MNVDSRTVEGDVVIVDIDGRDGLAQLERIVGMLRRGRYPVSEVSAKFGPDVATVAICGPELHKGDADTLVLRRLSCLPRVTAVRRPASRCAGGEGAVTQSVFENSDGAV
jgi:hypothetical protein